MQVVIEIPDEVMESREYVNYFEAWSAKLTSVIENAIVLPKEHGRLIDADCFKEKVLKWLPPDPCGVEEREHPYEADIVVSMLQEIEEAPTIIGADDGGEGC